MMLRLSAALLASTALFSLGFVSQASAQQPPASEANPSSSIAPVDLRAQEVTHDKSLNIVTARGGVEINQDGQTLFADTVSYNINQDSATASGNVSLITKTGEVVFAEHMTLTGKMKKGTLDNLLMITADKSRAAAYKGSRYIGKKGQQINRLDNGVYTACDSCRGKKNPLWQIKAKRIIHDEADKTINYYHAYMEMFGVPVAYTPYLFHADPTVKRRSGFLFPSLGSSSNLGWNYRQPYFWAISPYSDMTITPILAADSPSVMAVEYRQNLADAQFTFDGSGRIGGTRDSYKETDVYGNETTVPGSDAEMGHFNLEGEWHINDTLRASTELHAVSTDTYLSRYGLLGDEDYHNNVIALEAFAGEDYAKLDFLAFRELRELDSPPNNPYALPRMEWNHTSKAGSKGGYWTSKLSTVTLFRDEDDGATSNRISGSTAWTLPYIAPSGEHYALTTSLRGDLYNIQDYTKDNGETFDGTTGRIIPEISMRWSWPFSSAGKDTTQVIEPVVVASASPYGGNPDGIPNEDSLDFEFDAANALSTNHFSGYDRVETGPRVAYGLNWNAYDNGSSSQMSAFVGQTYRTKSDSIFDETRGIREGFSDIVADLRYDYNENLTGQYRFRIDEGSFDIVSHDLTLSGGTDVLRLGTTYLNQSSVEDYTTGNVADVEQVTFSVESQINKDWKLYAATNHNLSSADTSSGPLSFTSRATYEDECFELRFTASKDYTADRDEDSGFSFMTVLVFKSLGEATFNQ